MDMEKIEAEYNRLAMLHTETMAELVETRRRMDAMSGAWWWMFKHWVKVKLGIKNRYD
jgi:hypothetical protein